ncbi:MAG: prolipoprotein diacylglyceryl transferase family protein [Gemmatimonadaceae bacterium]
MKEPANRAFAMRLVAHRFLSLGPIRISTYLAMLYVGCVIGIMQGAMVARASGLDTMRFVVATVLLMIPAFAGSRLWFVAQRFETFRANPRAIWRSGDGGAALYGGLIGGIVFSPLVLAVVGAPFLQYWDAASITMLIAVVVTRLGCLMNGCCGGRETRGALGLWLPDYRGVWLRRFPTQLLESGWAAIVLTVVLNLQTRFTHPGTLFATVVAAYAAGRLLIEPTRESTNRFRTTYLNIGVSIALLALAGARLIYQLQTDR